MAAAVLLRSAVALLGGFPVLAGADLEVQLGEVVLLQGANGAGKTSLLRTCAGLLAVVSGRAEVLGCDLTADRRSVRRRVGLLGHATALYDDLTVEDNVRFAVRAAGGASTAVEPALVRLGLAGRLRSVAAGRLSAGQRRRTALAVLVARQPELWLLDEPHAGLDAEHRDLLDDLIRAAVAAGAAVVLASHERDRASALAHRTLTVAGGQVFAADHGAPRPTATGEAGMADVAQRGRGPVAAVLAADGGAPGRGGTGEAGVANVPLGEPGLIGAGPESPGAGPTHPVGISPTLEAAARVA